MRLFRITLSHGSESITFDGAGARSGSMFHVRRDAIEGLWSSPASKVSLTERETANGASPISDGETLYAARTVVIPFAIQSNYNHTDLIHARTLLGRLIGWHDVRMDINDDGDESVLYGYIEAKYSDIPYDHADTGTITLVCPDPRRVSKHESTVTLNTSSRSFGGLSFGVPAYELAWTGTPNASASTLSQDGTVVATNLHGDPGMTTTTNKGCWNGTMSVSNGVLTATPIAGAQVYSIYPMHLSGQWCGDNVTLPPGDYVFVFKSNVGPDAFHFDQTSGSTYGTVSGLGGFIIVPFHVNGPGKLTNVYLMAPTSQNPFITVSQAGIYTASDWAALQALGVDWFSGDSQSPQPNAGLAFPLDFGQTGNTGNTGMIENNGSYTSMPTITAHGSLDSGLTVHWNTSDGNEGDLSFNGNVGNVPVTINTDTHSAIMGGLDVSYQLGSRDWPRIPAGGSCSFALLASGSGWVTVQSHDTYM